MDDILSKNSCDELNHTKKGENSSESSDISSCVKNNWDDSIKKFQKHLLCIRTLLNLTPEQAGKLLGISRQTVTNLELGRTKMSVIQYAAIKLFYSSYFDTLELVLELELNEDKDKAILEKRFARYLTSYLAAPSILTGVLISCSGILLNNKQIKNQLNKFNEDLIDFIQDYSLAKEEDDKASKVLSAINNALSLDDITEDYIINFLALDSNTFENFKNVVKQAKKHLSKKDD